MDDIILNVTDNIRLSGDDLPLVTDDPGILMPSEVTSIPGPAGPPGKDGKDGQAASITVGSTTTGAAGTNASVQNVGTSSAAVLDFTIPRGATGQQGQAATITVGSTTTGAAGSDAIVQNVGTLNDAILDFTIPTGNDGAAATITVGSVTTVAPEYPATVTNSGTTSAAILDFNIPQGQTGAPGQDGADGQDGAPGADGQAATITVGTTTTGAAGTNASVTNTGTSSAAVLDFVIPRGADGAPGQDGADGQDGAPGADGQAATITVGSTTTGAAGTNASVTNSGTSSAAVLDFVIPRGDTGATGQTGPAGADAIVRTTTDSNNKTGIYYENGTLITYRRVTFSVAVNTAWGSLYRGVTPDYYTLAPSTDDDFISVPTVNVQPIATASSSFFMGCWENQSTTLINGRYAIPSGSISFLRPTSSNSVAIELDIIAIGKWK